MDPNDGVDESPSKSARPSTSKPSPTKNAFAPIPLFVVLPIERGGAWVGVVWLLLYLGEEIVYRLIAGPGATSLFGRDPRKLRFIGMVVLATLIAWVVDR